MEVVERVQVRALRECAIPRHCEPLFGRRGNPVSQIRCFSDDKPENIAQRGLDCFVRSQ